MALININPMPPFLSVTQLEPYIDHLILLCDELRRKNHILRKQLKQLEIENSQLSAKNQQASAKLKQAIHQLKEEIHERNT